MTEKIILASKSPRRKQLLEMAEVNFEVFAIDTDETFINSLPVEEIPIYIALQKALVVQEVYPERKILSADTIVVLDNKIINKPRDKQDAIEILTSLSNRTHKVITGVCILEKQKKINFCEITEVQFFPLTASQILHYVEHYKPYDKAGAYAIQEWIGAIGIRCIKGCYYNVMGLPVSRVVRELELI